MIILIIMILNICCNFHHSYLSLLTPFIILMVHLASLYAEMVRLCIVDWPLTIPAIGNLPGAQGVKSRRYFPLLFEDG